MLKRILVAAALLSASSAGAQTLEEAAVVIFDPAGADQWKKEGNAYTLADLSEPTLGRNYELTVKDCVISVIEWMKSTTNPEMYIQLSRLDLKKVIAGHGAVKYADWGNRTMLRSSLTASPGAYCYEVDKGVEPRVPTQTRLCERETNFVYGTQRYYEPRLLAGADVRMKRAYAFIRENHCKGRAF